MKQETIDYIKSFQAQYDYFYNEEDPDVMEDGISEITDHLEQYIINNCSPNEIDDEFENCFHPQLHYTFKESGETNRNKYKAGVIVSSFLDNM
jgi:hypothetical protein